MSVNLGYMPRRSVLKGLVLGAVAVSIPGTGALAAAGEGKTIVWGKRLEATLYDPATSILASSWELLHVIYDGLVDLDADMKPVPCLAESWDQPDDQTYVFRLRKGAKFSNGREISADDVAGSLKRLTDPGTGSFFLAQIGPVAEITANDDHSVTVKLSTPYAPFLTALASTMAAILPMRELSDGSFDPSKDFLGAGPFMVVGHQQGERWDLKRNPHYWDGRDTMADQLEVRIFGSDNALVAALRDGSVDIAQFDASPDSSLLVQGIPEVEVVRNAQSNLFWLLLNAVDPQSPFADGKVRQAVALSVDRKRIAEIGMAGNAEPACVIAPIFKAVDTGRLPLYSRDVERAKALLSEAGKSDLAFEIIGPGDAASGAIMQVLKESLAEAGITVTLSVLDEGALVQRAWVSNPSKFQAAISWYAGYSDPAMLPLWFVPAKAGFTAGYQADDPKVSEAVMALRTMASTDPGRKDAIQFVAEMLDDQANQIALITRVETLAYRKDLVDASAIRHDDGYADSLHGVQNYVKL